MNRSARRLRQCAGPALCLFLSLAIALISGFGCESSPTGQSPDNPGKIGAYSGTWTANGTSGTFDTTRSLVISSDLAYRQTVHQYESTAKLALASIKVVVATVTGIEVAENNGAYDTIFIDIAEVQLTPKSAGAADEWNTAAFGGVTTWVQDVTQTFTSSNPGPWEHGTIWQSRIAVSVQREGDLLNVNERGGFDGQDPPEDVYFLAD